MKKLFICLVVFGFMLSVPFNSHAIIITYKLVQLDDSLIPNSDYTGAWRYDFTVINDTQGDMDGLAFERDEHSEWGNDQHRIWDMLDYEGLPEKWGPNNVSIAWVFDYYEGFEPPNVDDYLNPGETWHFWINCLSFWDQIPDSLYFYARFHEPLSPDSHFSEQGYTVPTPVPEPASLFLLGSGLLGVAGLRRKMKK